MSLGYLTVISLLVTLPSICCLCMNQATRGSGLPSNRQSNLAVRPRGIDTDWRDEVNTGGPVIDTSNVEYETQSLTVLLHIQPLSLEFAV